VTGVELTRRLFGLDALDVNHAPGAPGAHFHDLRHHYASVLIQAGLNVKVVQERLGHATATETLDTYAHLWPDDEDRTRAAIDSVWVPAVSDLCQAEQSES
ncbi:MAG: tyrosine-type recombinase/integrase, partial [Acidimicrobiales bacterium]